VAPRLYRKQRQVQMKNTYQMALYGLVEGELVETLDPDQNQSGVPD
jgi:hypothetical protein